MASFEAPERNGSREWMGWSNGWMIFVGKVYYQTEVFFGEKKRKVSETEKESSRLQASVSRGYSGGVCTSSISRAI